MKSPQTRPGEPLPGGATTEQIAAGLAELTTARVTSHALLGRTFAGQETSAYGDGVADFTRRISSVNFVVKGRTVEQLGVGGDTYVRLSPDEQQATGKLWRWECHCPYGGCDLWAQIQAGLRQCGWFAGGGAEVSNGEPVHRYSFLISPQRNKSAPAMALLDAHLRSHGFDRLTLHAWLADDETMRKIRVHFTRVDVLGMRQEGFQETEYVDFGIAVDLAAPSPDRITGKPRRLRGYRRGRRSRQLMAAAGPSD